MMMRRIIYRYTDIDLALDRTLDLALDHTPVTIPHQYILVWQPGSNGS